MQRRRVVRGQDDLAHAELGGLNEADVAAALLALCPLLRGHRPAENHRIHKGDVGVGPLHRSREQDGGRHLRPSVSAHVHRVPRSDGEQSGGPIASVLKHGPVESRAFPRPFPNFLRNNAIANHLADLKPGAGAFFPTWGAGLCSLLSTRTVRSVDEMVRCGLE